MQVKCGREAALVLTILLVASVCGCQSLSQRQSWKPPLVAAPRSVITLVGAARENNIARAASIYAEALRLEANGDGTCVDHYYQAAILAWDGVSGCDSTTVNGRSRQIYHSALTRLIESGQVHRRLLPSNGLTIRNGPDQFQVPILQRGFPRRPEEIDRLELVGEYTSPNVKHIYRSDGIGVPVVAIRRKQPGDRFQPQRRLYAATVVLRRTERLNSASRLSVLEINDALRVPTVEASRGLLLPMYRDITSPIAFALKDKHSHFINNFLHGSDNTDNSGLTMIEPYQPGKIPLVLSHGLLSDRFTWANLANEVRANPDGRFVEHFHAWPLVVKCHRGS